MITEEHSVTGSQACETADIAAKHFTKQRYIWQPGAWRLLREPACAEYVREVVPHTIDGVHIRFPQTEATFGCSVMVTTSGLAGRSLFEVLGDMDAQETAVQLGLISLEAWHRAQVAGWPFPLFGTIFRLVKGPIALMSMLHGTPSASLSQRREFARLLARYMAASNETQVLVHGDLHTSHIIVDLETRTLGFIDLETVHVGKAATDFSLLWIGYHYASPQLGRRFYLEYATRFPDLLTAQFDNDVRVELALRSHKHVGVGRRTVNRELEARARAIFDAVLGGPSFEELCLKGALD